MSRPAHPFVVRAFLTWSLLCTMPELGLAVARQAPQPPAEVPPAPSVPAIEAPSETTVGDHVRVRTLGGGTRVRIGGPVVVERGERVEDVVAILGDVTVRGEVEGDAVAVLGSVRVEDQASVRGQVVAVGGRIEAAPGARILGGAEHVAIGFPEIRVEGPGHDSFSLRWLPDRHWLASVALGSSLLRLTALLVLALTAALVFPRFVRRAADQAACGAAESFIIGLGLQLLLLPAVLALCVALTVSLIGLPLVPVVILLAGGVWLLGFAGAAVALGRVLLRVAVVGEPSMATSVLVGGAPFALLTLASRFGWWSGGEMTGWWLAVAMAGIVLEGVLWCVGAGALLLAWLRRTTPAAMGTPPAMTPPVPPVPVQP